MSDFQSERQEFESPTSLQIKLGFIMIKKMKKRKNTKRVTEEEALEFAKAVNKSARSMNE